MNNLKSKPTEFELEYRKNFIKDKQSGRIFLIILLLVLIILFVVWVPVSYFEYQSIFLVIMFVLFLTIFGFVLKMLIKGYSKISNYSEELISVEGKLKVLIAAQGRRGLPDRYFINSIELDFPFISLKKYIGKRIKVTMFIEQNEDKMLPLEGIVVRINDESVIDKDNIKSQGDKRDRRDLNSRPLA